MKSAKIRRYVLGAFAALFVSALPALVMAAHSDYGCDGCLIRDELNL